MHAIKTIDARGLRQMLDNKEDVLLLNVLGQEAFERAHIPESRNIPADAPNFVQTVEEAAGSKTRRIVVYCASTECQASPTAARKLKDAGFTNVVDFEGGMKAWKDAGYEVRRETPVPATGGAR
jgi:rhodanese-related sulfurtransferase